MPTPLMKSLAKEAHKKTKTVEKLWAKSEKIVKQKYQIDDSSSRYWPLVVGVTKGLLGISKKEKQLEEDEITTTNMGSNNGDGAMFANKVGEPMTRIDGPITPVKTTITKKKNYGKEVKEIVKKVNEKALKESLDDIMSDAIEYYSSKSNNVEEVFEQAIASINKRLGIEVSVLDK